MSDRAWRDKIQAVSLDEVKSLCMELYIKYGERAFEEELPNDDEDVLAYHACIKYVNPRNMSCMLLILTPKALELIKGNTNETKT